MNALSIKALVYCLEPDMLLFKVRAWLDRLMLPEWIAMPLYDCTYCMSSFWSLVFFVVRHHYVCFDLLFVMLVTLGFQLVITKAEQLLPPPL